MGVWFGMQGCATGAVNVHYPPPAAGGAIRFIIGGLERVLSVSSKPWFLISSLMMPLGRATFCLWRWAYLSVLFL
jgi:hypothetical protein